MSPLRCNGLFVCSLQVSVLLGNVLPFKYSVVEALDTYNSKNLNFNETTFSYGYKTEEHTVTTEDGYLLALFRITKGFKCHRMHRTPVLLMHGLLQNADCWLDAGPKAGLAYLTADACFDTWVGSVRGTHYSRRHIHLNPDRDKEFWQFSVDEIGLHDVPAMIDYILKETGLKQLNYVGFSQGAGTFFIMCSERPGYCDKSKMLIALAPATRHFYTQSFLFRYVPQFIMRHRRFLDEVGQWEIFARRLPLHGFLSRVCQHKQASQFCEWVLGMLDAPHSRSITSNTLKLLFQHVLAGTSTQNIARYGQSVLSEKFNKFNYGKLKNVELYGSETPPEYNLTAVSVPTVVIYGKNDGIVDKKDVEWVVSKLPNVKEVIAVKDQFWTHLDMTFSKYISVMVFPSIHKYLMQYD